MASFFDQPRFQHWADALRRELEREGVTLTMADARWYFANDYDIWSARDDILRNWRRGNA